MGVRTRRRELSWSRVLARRLERSGLLETAPRGELAQAVGRVCGLQAQVLAAAELGASARVAGLTQEHLRQELWESRSLVKVWGMRGTLHLFPAEELPLWMAARRAPALRSGREWFDSWGLDSAQAEALLTAVAEVLDGRELTRDELANEVGGRLGAWARKGLASQWGALVSLPMAVGAICFGRNRGTNVTFVRTDQWLGELPHAEPDEALLEVLRRFLAAYGPARPRDFAAWFAPDELKAGDVRELLRLLGDEVEEVDALGTRAWMLAADASEDAPEAASSLRLLPQYDCYYLGARLGRERIFPPDVVAPAPIKFEGPVQLSWLLVDGVAAGYWQRQRRGSRLELRIFLLRRLARAERRRLDEEIERVGAFCGLEPAPTVTDA